MSVVIKKTKTAMGYDHTCEFVYDDLLSAREVPLLVLWRALEHSIDIAIDLLTSRTFVKNGNPYGACS